MHLSNQKITEKLSAFPCQERSLLPTPIHLLDWLSATSECRVFCKRDDLTGFGMGGNKTRKLDFLVADALKRGCDTLLAVGANQSNFCRVVAAYGAVNQLEVHLVLGGAKPGCATGNLLLDHLAGAECHHVESSDWVEWEKASGQLEKSLTQSGRKVYRMPVGGSTPFGALGYVKAMAEIGDDQKRMGLAFDAIVHASSSAGTQAGLVVGKALMNWPGKIVGINVAKPAGQQEKDVRLLARQTAEMLGASDAGLDIRVEDGYLGEGYACETDACKNAVDQFAKRSGIFMDRVYTGKAAAGLIDLLEKQRFPKETNVLFLHTGGSAEIFSDTRSKSGENA